MKSFIRSLDNAVITLGVVMTLLAITLTSLVVHNGRIYSVRGLLRPANRPGEDRAANAEKFVDAVEKWTGSAQARQGK